MTLLINSVLDTRDKAILTLLAKTGVRRGELIAMDIDDIDWARQAITLKKYEKRRLREVMATECNMSVRTTSASCLANTLPMLAPIPCRAPVTIATLPASFPIVLTTCLPEVGSPGHRPFLGIR